jgi:hypothetical protein
MAVSCKWFGNALLKALSKEVAFTTDTVKVMLCTSSYTPDQDAHIYKSSVTNEAVGTAGTTYVAGGATLTSKTMTYTAATNVIMLDAADVSWGTTGNPTARYAIVYVSTGTDSTSPLLGFVDFGADVVVLGIAWDPAGILTVTVS